MWRTAVRSAALARPFNAEVSQVIVRYASNTVPRKPTAAKSAITKVTTQGTTSTKSTASKAAKASAPTKSPPKHGAKTSASIVATPKKPSTPKSTPKPAPKLAPTPTPTASVTSAALAGEPVVRAIAPKSAATHPVVDPSKPIVLEKPERFNPPSHGSRLPRSTPRHYGGSMTAEEVQAQGEKTYPGLPPPPNTWSHRFINNRGVHMFITLGTLTSLAIYTFAMNFQAKSPFADMIPPISELPRHPFQYIGVCFDVLRLHEEHESAQTAEKRRRRVDDVAKRNEYRKAHGLEPANSGFFGSKAAVAEETAETTDAASPTAVVESLESEPEPEPNAAEQFTPEGKRKKFMGIF